MEIQPVGEIQPSSQWTDEILDWFKKEDLKRPRKVKRNRYIDIFYNSKKYMGIKIKRNTINN